MKRITILAMSVTLYASIVLLGNLNSLEASELELIVENKKVTILGEQVGGPLDCYSDDSTGDVLCQLSGPSYEDEAGFGEMIEMMVEAEAYAAEESLSCPAEPEPSSSEESPSPAPEGPPPETANATSSSSTQGECRRNNNGVYCGMDLCFTGHISPLHGFGPDFSGFLYNKCVTMSPQQMSESSALFIFGSSNKSNLKINLPIGPPSSRNTYGTMTRYIKRFPFQFPGHDCTLEDEEAQGVLKCNQNAVCPPETPLCKYFTGNAGSENPTEWCECSN